MQLLLPLLTILGLNAAMTLLFRKKFGEVLPLTLLSAALLVVLFGFLDILPLGVNIVMALGLLSYAAVICLFLARRELFRQFRENYFSLGFALFLLVYAFLFVTDYTRKIQNWDELGYWSLRVKEMMRIDQLYNAPDSLLPLHRDYPPFLACFQYFWCKTSGGFRDGWMYLSTHILELSMLIPCVEYFDKKNFRKNCVTVFMTFLLIVAAGLFVDIEDAAMLFKSIYSDAFMAVLSAYLLFFVFMKEKIDWFYRLNVCLGSAALMLSKPSGLGFFLIILIVMTVRQIMLHKDNCQQNKASFLRSLHKGKLALNTLFAAVIPYLCYQIWEWYVISLGVTRQFDPEENRNLVKFVQIFLGGGEAYQTETIENYIKGLISTPLLQRPVPMTWWQIFLLTIALFEILAYLTRDQIDRRYIRMLNIVTACSALGYAFYMSVLYVFSYDRIEATSLASFRRYLNTYWMCIWTFLLLLSITLLAKKAKETANTMPLWALLAVLWVGFISPEEVLKIIPTSPSVSGAVLAENLQEDDTVYVLQETDNLYTLTFLRYTVWPHTVEGSDYETLKAQETAEELLDTLSGFDYLYVKESDAEFFNSLGISPADQEAFEDQALYQIITADQNIEFRFIAKQ